MPPRYAYWTIIAGGLPTAFRTAARDELLPTFQRIKEKHPDAQMKYFARGKLWDSQEAAREADRRGSLRRPSTVGRDRDWRPGGEHRDPRQKFVDQKRQRNATMRKERWERNQQKHEAKPQRPWQRKPRTRTPEREEQVQPSRPRGRRREPKPSDESAPTRARRAEQPDVPSSRPPEGEHTRARRAYQPRGKFPKGPRR